MFGERSQVVKNYRELSCSGSAHVRGSGQLFEEKKQLWEAAGKSQQILDFHSAGGHENQLLMNANLGP